MNQAGDPPLFSRSLRVDEIKDDERGEISAAQSEMKTIAALLDLKALEGLGFTYSFRHGGGGRLLLSGTLKAEITQICVVSLDPVTTALEVPVEAAFWPETMLEALEQQTEDSGSAELLDWPEPIKDGKIDLGPLIYETLATALDPYPKREGASFEWSQGTEEGSEAETGPFAALEDLKRR
ncbi:MAG: DUF177 domain-containing protein [Methyloceanibacter sp.]